LRELTVIPIAGFGGGGQGKGERRYTPLFVFNTTYGILDG